jgi:ComF family protein
VGEAVFSSTGFRIRAAKPTATIAPVGCWAEHVAASLFFTLFPADCRICNAPLLQISRVPVCADCLNSVRPLSGSLCTRCGEALPYSISSDGDSSLVSARQAADSQVSGYRKPEHQIMGYHIDDRCRRCQLAQLPFARAVAYGSYDGALRDLIHLLKFDQVRPAAKVLGPLLAASIAALEPSLPAGAIAVVPVPLHAHKQSQRGFNQAELIARAALKELSRSPQGSRFELFPRALMRVRDTGSQIGLTRHQRRENLRGAFRVDNPTQVRDRNILLVDDVYTTGATASECTRALLRAGAAQVWVATVGRTIKVYSWPGTQQALPGDLDEGTRGQEESGEQYQSRLSIAKQG